MTKVCQGFLSIRMSRRVFRFLIWFGAAGCFEAPVSGIEGVIFSCRVRSYRH